MARKLSAALGCAGLMGAVSLLAGCNLHPHESTDEQVRRQAAEDTRQIRKDAQQAGVEARKAAEEARRNAQDIVAGVRQGWREGGGAKGGSGGGDEHRLDLNTASAGDLSALPGLSDGDARRIVRHRPYRTPGELVSRQVLTEDQYDRVAAQVEAHGKAGHGSD